MSTADIALVAFLVLLIVPQVVLACWLGSRRDGVSWRSRQFWA